MTTHECAEPTAGWTTAEPMKPAPASDEDAARHGQTGKSAGNFANSGSFPASLVSKSVCKFNMLWEKFPDQAEQGLLFCEQGKAIT
jgi:hypothetical protein